MPLYSSCCLVCKGYLYFFFPLTNKRPVLTICLSDVQVVLTCLW